MRKGACLIGALFVPVQRMADASIGGTHWYVGCEGKLMRVVCCRYTPTTLRVPGNACLSVREDSLMGDSSPSDVKGGRGGRREDWVPSERAWPAFYFRGGGREVIAESGKRRSFAGPRWKLCYERAGKQWFCEVQSMHGKCFSRVSSLAIGVGSSGHFSCSESVSLMPCPLTKRVVPLL